jgi:hypothetical protein
VTGAPKVLSVLKPHRAVTAECAVSWLRQPTIAHPYFRPFGREYAEDL